MGRMLRTATAVFFAGSSTAAYCQSAEDIIVTAEKQPLTIQQTTASVSVLSTHDIVTNGFRTVQDAYDRLVNLTPTFGSGGVSIRGISNIGVSGAGEASTITMYVDGVPLASTYLQAAPTQLWDVYQVEILRGPQSTVQGLNALAGAIVIRTSDPRLDRWEGAALASWTNERSRQLAGAISGPLVPETLAVRISGEVRQRDGFIRNLTRDTTEDREDRTTIRGKLLWHSPVLEDFTVQIAFTHFQRNGGFFNVYARTDPIGFPETRIATDNEPNKTKVDYNALSTEVRYPLNDDLSFTSATNWSDVSEASTFDGDYGPQDASFGRQARRYRTLTQEFRVNLESDRVSGVGGMFYYDRNLVSRTTSRTDVPTPSGTIAGLLTAGGLSSNQAIGIANAYVQALPAIRVDFDGSFPTRVRSYAAFTDFRIRLRSNLELLGGFRIDHEVNRTQNSQRSIFAGMLPQPTTFGALAPVIAQINGAVASFVQQSNANLPESRQGFTTFLPKLGIRYELNDTLAAAFVAQRGYRSGGLSTNIARAQSVPYDPEHTWNYELSLRKSFLDGRLNLNANAYYIDWQDQQVTVNFGLNSFDTNTVNAGRSRLYGFELEAKHAIFDWLTLIGAVGHQNTRFLDFRIPQTGGGHSNLSGQVFAFAPRWTLVGGASWHASSGWDGAITAKYASSSFGAVGVNQANYPVRSHTTVNARFGYQRDKWSMHAQINNLLNKSYIMYKSPIENRAVLNDPRTIGIEARVYF